MTIEGPVYETLRPSSACVAKVACLARLSLLLAFLAGSAVEKAKHKQPSTQAIWRPSLVSHCTARGNRCSVRLFLAILVQSSVHEGVAVSLTEYTHHTSILGLVRLPDASVLHGTYLPSYRTVPLVYEEQNTAACWPLGSKHFCSTQLPTQ